ncbi:MAG: caspase family protein [Cyanobacteria bacterium P01_F01_bin.143]
MSDRKSKIEKLERKGTPVVATEESVNQGKSIIVSIGIDKYENWQQLNNGVNDALGFQQVMVDKLGFTAPIEPLINENATKDAIERLVEEQLREIVEEDDNLIIFFAGHGHTREETETGYIIPIEARSPSPKEYWGDYIRLDPWLVEIAELPARHILVILDACHSGFALGKAMNSFRDSVTYKKDLNNKKSRKVITSARREQPALDGGSIPGHSLFTGTLIDGFNWGKADLDGNGLITSLELGLYVQQKVGQASESQQTPDFGSFFLDNRGEMIIALRDQSFDALKARAFSALQRCEFTEFRKLVNQLLDINPSHLGTLYLDYRMKFLDCDFEAARQRIFQMNESSFNQRELEIQGINIQNLLDSAHRLSCWQDVLSIQETQEPLPVSIFPIAGLSKNEMNKLENHSFGEIKAYPIEFDSVFKFRLSNTSQNSLHIYMVEIDQDGYFETVTLWEDQEILLDGLMPGQEKLTYPFRQDTLNGTCELRFFVSSQRIPFLLFPASPKTRGIEIGKKITSEELSQIKMKTIRYTTIQKTLINN